MLEINVCILFTGKNSWYQVWGEWRVGLGSGRQLILRGAWELKNPSVIHSNVSVWLTATHGQQLSWEPSAANILSHQEKGCSNVIFLLVDFRFHIGLGIWIVISTYLQRYSWLFVFYMDLSFCKGWLLSHFLPLEKDFPQTPRTFDILCCPDLPASILMGFLASQNSFFKNCFEFIQFHI